MKRFFKYSCNFFILIVLSILWIGCGSVDDGEETIFDPFLDDPDYYEPGDTVRGGDFSFIDVNVEGFIWDANENDFVKLNDGDYVSPGKHRIAIRADNRRDPSLLSSSYQGLDYLIQGSPLDQRVYLSDGGLTYLVEAFLDEERGMYMCDIDIDGTYPVYSLLIEVLYRDGMAKKDKIVLDTREHVRAPVNYLVKEGLILGFNDDFVIDLLHWAAKDEALIQSVLGILNSVFCDAFVLNVANRIVGFDFVLDSLVPLVLALADISPGDNSLVEGHFRNFNDLLTVDINIEDKFEHGDIVEGPLPIEIGVSAVGANIMFDRIVQIVIPWIVKALGEPVSLDLDSLLMPIEEDLFNIVLDVVDIKIDYAEKLVDQVFNNILPTNLTVFGTGFGRPEENTEHQFFAYLSGFLTDSRKLPSREELAMVGRCSPEWPSNTIMDDSVQVDLSPIKKDTTDIGVAVSGFMINSLMGQVSDTLEIEAPSTVVNLLFAILPQLKDMTTAKLTGKLLFNPHGFTFDFYDSDTSGPVKGIIGFNDIDLTLLDNEAPVTIMSIDLFLEFSLAFRWENGNWYADLGLKVINEKSNIHVFEDKVGLVVFDHSTFMKAILEVFFLGKAYEGESQPFTMHVNLTEILGVLPKQEGTDLSLKDNNVYLNLAFDHQAPVDWNVLGKWLEKAFNL